MFKGLGNIANMLKQAQQMGTKMQAITEELKGRRITGSAGAGLIEVEANGVGDILRVTIQPDLVERRDREMIEDLLPAAVNQALAKSKQLHAEALKELTGGMDLPGMQDMLGKFSPEGNG